MPPLLCLLTIRLLTLMMLLALLCNMATVPSTVGIALES